MCVIKTKPSVDNYKNDDSDEKAFLNISNIKQVKIF